MTDRELLELAAKAAGINGGYASSDEFPEWMTVHDGEGIYYTSSQAWNPLIDDGDALRLAVKLGMIVRQPCKGVVTAYSDTPKFMATPPTEYIEPDPYAATRRAIVRAAAEIGRMK